MNYTFPKMRNLLAFVCVVLFVSSLFGQKLKENSFYFRVAAGYTNVIFNDPLINYYTYRGGRLGSTLVELSFLHKKSFFLVSYNFYKNLAHPLKLNKNFYAFNHTKNNGGNLNIIYFKKMIVEPERFSLSVGACGTFQKNAHEENYNNILYEYSKGIRNSFFDFGLIAPSLDVIYSRGKMMFEFRANVGIAGLLSRPTDNYVKSIGFAKVSDWKFATIDDFEFYSFSLILDYEFYKKLGIFLEYYSIFTLIKKDSYKSFRNNALLGLSLKI